VTGAHVPTRDPHALAARVRQLLIDQELRRRMGAEGSRRVARRYTWQQVAAETETVYERLLGGTAGADDEAPDVIDLREPVAAPMPEVSPQPLQRNAFWDGVHEDPWASEDTGRKDI
jgi:Glycosyl transferases group 1